MITFSEVIDAAIMSAALGFIFMDAFPKRHKVEDYLKPKSFDWDAFWFACAVTAPSVIIHELGHKFTAIAFGLHATFHAAYTWLFFGVLLKVLNTGLIFFVPGYVAIAGVAPPLHFAIVAFAGPFWHLILWYGPKLVLKHHKHMRHNTKFFLILLSKINGFLLVFNLLPIPGFDGFSIYPNLFKVFF